MPFLNSVRSTYGAKGRFAYKPPLGGGPSNPATSGVNLLANRPGIPSGFYWIKSASMPNALLMYVDTTTEGGGYDYYQISNGTATSYYNAPNSAKTLGLDLVYARSQAHYASIYNFCVNVLGVSASSYNTTCNGVYTPQRTVGTGNYPGGSCDTTYSCQSTQLNGNYTAYAMRSGSVPDWRVPDGGRWWIRDSATGEPNGDHCCNGFLSSSGPASDGSIAGFNDGGASSTGTTYIASTNAKG